VQPEIHFAHVPASPDIADHCPPLGVFDLKDRISVLSFCQFLSRLSNSVSECVSVARRESSNVSKRLLIPGRRSWRLDLLQSSQTNFDAKRIEAWRASVAHKNGTHSEGQAITPLSSPSTTTGLQGLQNAWSDSAMSSSGWVTSSSTHA